MQLDISDFDRLQRLRTTLQNINQVGYDFRTFDQRYPINNLTPLQGDQVRLKLQRFISNVIRIVDDAQREGLMEGYEQ